jgi:hypothetical protein
MRARPRLHSIGGAMSPYAALPLADWVAYLYRDTFDLARWTILHAELKAMEMSVRLMPTWQLCLPEFKASLKSESNRSYGTIRALFHEEFP